MGCDIHCYIEHGRKVKDPDGAGERIAWTPFNYTGINPGRDYAFFARIAGVRNYENRIPQLFEPRGMPEDASWSIRSENELYIDDESAEKGHERYCSELQADSWVASGCSELRENNRVTHPDWHSHTWLTPMEWRQACEAPSKYGTEVAYFGIAAMLEEFEARGELARIIIWFDN